MKTRDISAQFEVHIAGVKSDTKLCDLTVRQFVQLVSQLSAYNAQKLPDKKTIESALEQVRMVISDQKGQAHELKEVVNSARTAILENLASVITRPGGQARDGGKSPAKGA
jgi:hypothetical protein